MKEKSKGLINKLTKIFFVFTFIVFFIAAVGFGIGFLIQTKELNDLRGLYSTAEENLNEDLEENQDQIENLEESFRNLQDENSDLREEKSKLEEDVKELRNEAYGKVSGEILPFIVGGADINQYQEVCAEKAENNQKQYCLTVSALEKKYSLLLPPGSYYFYATIDSTEEKLQGYKAYYTEYVKCTNENGAEECEKTEESKNVKVEVIAGGNIENVDPIDWEMQGE